MADQCLSIAVAGARLLGFVRSLRTHHWYFTHDASELAAGMPAQVGVLRKNFDRASRGEHAIGDTGGHCHRYLFGFVL
jgi:hypothetical protein